MPGPRHPMVAPALTLSRMRGSGGMTLIEVLSATLVLSLGLLALASLQITAMRANAYARDLSQATAIAKTCMEELLAAPYSSLQKMTESRNANIRGFSARTAAEPLVPQTAGVLLTVNVTWRQGERTHSMKLQSLRKPS